MPRPTAKFDVIAGLKFLASIGEYVTIESDDEAWKVHVGDQSVDEAADGVGKTLDEAVGEALRSKSERAQTRVREIEALLSTGRSRT